MSPKSLVPLVLDIRQAVVGANSWGVVAPQLCQHLGVRQLVLLDRAAGDTPGTQYLHSQADDVEPSGSHDDAFADDTPPALRAALQNLLRSDLPIGQLRDLAPLAGLGLGAWGLAKLLHTRDRCIAIAVEYPNQQRSASLTQVLLLQRVANEMRKALVGAVVL